MKKIKLLLISLILFSTSLCAEIINVTILGSGNPRPHVNKYGPSILVKTNEYNLIFDVGRATLIRLKQVGLNVSDIDKIFISHMHFDHIVGLPDVWLTAKLWQKESLNVYGPKGLKKFCSDMIELYKIDARYRNKGNLSLKCNEDLHNVELKEDLIVKRFSVNHGHVRNAYGYEIIHKGKKIVYSGDTTISDNLIERAKGADVLIHEIIYAPDDFIKKNKRFQKVYKSHTNVEQIIKILNITKPKLAVITHDLIFFESPKNILKMIKDKYNGEIIFAEDLTSFDIGNTINKFNYESYR